MTTVTPTQVNDPVVHNFSSFYLTTHHINLLNKGLSFSPHQLFNTKDHSNILTQFDTFSVSLRNIALKPFHTTEPETNQPTTDTTFLFRRMKFLKAETAKDQLLYITNNDSLENFIASTKIIIDSQLRKKPSRKKKRNISKKELKAIRDLKHTRVVIKPADKNLGIAVLNTEDYIDQCLAHLSTNTYTRTGVFPSNQIKVSIENTLIKFCDHLKPYKKLHQYLQPNYNHQTPQFYGLPKIHKPPNNNGIPPVRPIVAHTNSLLSKTAQFIDHVLQPVAQSYEDYIKNSTQLISILESLTFTDDIVLVTMDVTNLYPSIPQQECLNIIYKEMFEHSDLLIFDPNLITHLLELNMNNNYFEFAGSTFLQVDGTAMGAAFSPTIANIFMSTIVKQFLSTTPEKPILLKRYIDDIFMVWPKCQNLNNFLHRLNNHHPQIKFTFMQSTKSIDFLDITVYKDSDFNKTGKLSTSTYQKENNLYQYLHFTSNHPQSIFRALIIGEATRYVRTNSSREMYYKQLRKLSERLKKRDYPLNFIKKSLRRVNYKNRAQYIQNHNKPISQPLTRPVFKCIPPPNYHHLKGIIMDNFVHHKLTRYFKKPLFIPLKNTTLKDIIVRSRHKPTSADKENITRKTKITTQANNHNTKLPNPKEVEKPKPCEKTRCKTCQHFVSSESFKSTVTKQSFRIRHPFTCNSSNIIYLITCSQCGKQYVGKTLNTLRERMNQHRSSIKINQQRYISKHFNLEHHSIANLKVQVIDTIPTTCPEDLEKVEQYWIHKLKTTQPRGLNVFQSEPHTSNNPIHT